MRVEVLVVCCISFLVMPESFADVEIPERPAWKMVFDKFEATGTIFVDDRRSLLKNVSVHNRKRAKKRYSPASTYKVPHTLFALDSGLVVDEFQVFHSDDTRQSFELHSQELNLRSAMRQSARWVYEQFASKMKQEKVYNYLVNIDYGNMDPSSQDSAYWIDGNLAISAEEQVIFLEKLYRNDLPFEREHQFLLKDIMIVEAQKDWILRAKTGWEGNVGWWIGWVELPTGPVFFALNIDTPNRWDDLYKREAIVRDILSTIGALPE